MTETDAALLVAAGGGLLAVSVLGFCIYLLESHARQQHNPDEPMLEEDR